MEIWIDDTCNTCYIRQFPNIDWIFSTRLEGDKIKVSYNDGWEEFLKESNIQELIGKGESALARSRAFSSGKGKGKLKGKSKNIPSHSASTHNFAQAPWHKK